jgi:hypothetical protein
MVKSVLKFVGKLVAFLIGFWFVLGVSIDLANEPSTPAVVLAVVTFVVGVVLLSVGVGKSTETLLDSLYPEEPPPPQK